MSKYECKVCGYIYDEAKGEYTENIPAGKDFDSLGKDWRCPVCDATKEDFVKLEQSDSNEGSSNVRQ